MKKLYTLKDVISISTTKGIMNFETDEKLYFNDPVKNCGLEEGQEMVIRYVEYEGAKDFIEANNALAKQCGLKIKKDKIAIEYFWDGDEIIKEKDFFSLRYDIVVSTKGLDTLSYDYLSKHLAAAEFIDYVETIKAERIFKG